eukprot:1138770-Pleurochrysis_carterae.AAC.1
MPFRRVSVSRPFTAQRQTFGNQAAIPRVVNTVERTVSERANMICDSRARLCGLACPHCFSETAQTPALFTYHVSRVFCACSHFWLSLRGKCSFQIGRSQNLAARRLVVLGRPYSNPARLDAVLAKFRESVKILPRYVETSNLHVGFCGRCPLAVECSGL